MIGIYKITSPSGRIYIGQTRNFENRKIHYKYLNENNKQKRLHSSFIRYGIENHNMEFIEECEFNNLNKVERKWQDYYNVLSKQGLNCVLTETDELPRVYSEKALEHRRKINLGSGNPMYGKKGILNNKSKKVINTQTNQIWNSLTECCIENNLNSKYMSRWLNGSRKNNTIYKYI
jgi:group I intron endonuclease